MKFNDEQQAELDRLEASRKQSEAGAEEAVQRLKAAEAEGNQMRVEIALKDALRGSGLKFHAGALDDAASFLKDQVQMKDGKAIVVDKEGHIRAISTADLVREFAETKPHFFQNDSPVEARTVPGTNTGVQLEQLFGKTMNGKLANDFALKHPAQYKVLRAKAVAQGLIKK